MKKRTTGTLCCAGVLAPAVGSRKRHRVLKTTCLVRSQPVFKRQLFQKPRHALQHDPCLPLCGQIDPVGLTTISCDHHTLPLRRNGPHTVLQPTENVPRLTRRNRHRSPMTTPEYTKQLSTASLNLRTSSGTAVAGSYQPRYSDRRRWITSATRGIPPNDEAVSNSPRVRR